LREEGYSHWREITCFCFHSRFDVVFAQRHHHNWSAVLHGCRLSATELFRSPPAVSTEQNTAPSHVCTVPASYLRSVSQQLGRDVTAKLVSAFVCACVLSRLDCCNAVLTGLPVSTLAPLQRVLSATARVVVGLGPRDHVTPSLCQLHWLPIPARIDYKLCLLVHKSFVGQVPDYITELLTPAASDPSLSSLRSSSSSNLIVRRARRKIGDRAFAVAAPRVWNRLPTELKIMRSTPAFKRHLKTYLFSFVYGPS